MHEQLQQLQQAKPADETTAGAAAADAADETASAAETQAQPADEALPAAAADALDETAATEETVSFNSKLFIKCSKFLIAFENYNGVRVFYKWSRKRPPRQISLKSI